MMEQPHLIAQTTTEDTSWFINALLGAFGVLAAVVAYLYKAAETANFKQIVKLETKIEALEHQAKKCFDDREALREKISELRITVTTQQDEIADLQRRIGGAG